MHTIYYFDSAACIAFIKYKVLFRQRIVQIFTFFINIQDNEMNISIQPPLKFYSDHLPIIYSFFLKSAFRSIWNPKESL